MKLPRIATVSTAIAACVVMAACSGGGGQGALGSGDSITVITSAAPWNPAYEAVVKAYEKESGVHVNLRPFPNDDVKTKMLNDAQSGTHAFDVYQINEIDLAQFNANKLLLPLTDIDSGYRLDPKIYTYGNLPYWDATKKSFSASGKLTSVPLLGNLQLFVYRKDIYAKLGLKPPTTWEQALANAKAVAKARAARYGYVMRYQGVPGSAGVTYDFAGILYGEGGSFFRKPGVDWTPAVDTPQAVRAATVFRQLAELGPADPKAVGQAEAIAAMQSGDAAQLDVVAAAASSMNDKENSNVAGKVGFAVLPGRASATGTWNLGVPADLPKDRRSAALDFIKWVTSAKGMKVFTQAGGIPTRSDAYDGPDVPKASRAYLDAVKQSAPTAQGAFRFDFGGPFLNVTEPILGAIAAGDMTPKAGMAKLQKQLTKVVKDAGYPMR